MIFGLSHHLSRTCIYNTCMYVSATARSQKSPAADHSRTSSSADTIGYHKRWFSIYTGPLVVHYENRNGGAVHKEHDSPEAI